MPDELSDVANADGVRQRLEDNARLAGRLRARNKSWDDVAKVLGYASAESCENMTRRPTTAVPFHEAFDQERDRYIQEAEGEALIVERELLRSKRAIIRHKAGSTLLNHAAKLKAQRVQVTSDGTIDLAVNHSGKIAVDLFADVDAMAERIKARLGGANPLGIARQDQPGEKPS